MSYNTRHNKRNKNRRNKRKTRRTKRGGEPITSSDKNKKPSTNTSKSIKQT